VYRHDGARKELAGALRLMGCRVVEESPAWTADTRAASDAARRMDIVAASRDRTDAIDLTVVDLRIGNDVGPTARTLAAAARRVMTDIDPARSEADPLTELSVHLTERVSEAVRAHDAPECVRGGASFRFDAVASHRTGVASPADPMGVFSRIERAEARKRARYGDTVTVPNPDSPDAPPARAPVTAFVVTTAGGLSSTASRLLRTLAEQDVAADAAVDRGFAVAKAAVLARAALSTAVQRGNARIWANHQRRDVRSILQDDRGSGAADGANSVSEDGFAGDETPEFTFASHPASPRARDLTTHAFALPGGASTPPHTPRTGAQPPIQRAHPLGAPDSPLDTPPRGNGESTPPPTPRSPPLHRSAGAPDPAGPPNPSTGTFTPFTTGGCITPLPADREDDDNGDTNSAGQDDDDTETDSLGRPGGALPPETGATLHRAALRPSDTLDTHAAGDHPTDDSARPGGPDHSAGERTPSPDLPPPDQDTTSLDLAARLTPSPQHLTTDNPPLPSRRLRPRSGALGPPLRAPLRARGQHTSSATMFNSLGRR
jgi:hypothetical protein